MKALLTVALILSFWAPLPVPQGAQRTNDLIDLLHGQHEPYAEFFGQIKDAFASNDPKRIASLIEYPFRRHRRGEVVDIIEISEEFVRKFSEIVTPRVFEAVALVCSLNQPDEPLFHDDAIIQMHSRTIQDHVHVNGASSVASIENIVADGDVHQAARLFLFFKISVVQGARVEADPELGNVVCVFNGLNDVAQLLRLEAIPFHRGHLTLAHSDCDGAVRHTHVTNRPIHHNDPLGCSLQRAR